MAYQYQGHTGRRIVWINIGVIALGLVVVIRLFQLQVASHNQYLASAASQQSRKFIVPANRGEIFVHDGSDTTPIALNQTLGLLYGDPSEIKDAAATAQALAVITGDKASDYLADLQKGGSYQVLKQKIPQDQVDKINNLGLVGIGITNQSYRVYPEGSLASQLLGFVNASGVGQYGVEGYLNSDLGGTPGLLKVKTDTLGNPIAIANSVDKPAVDGKSYVLTIDRNIQAEVEKELAAGVQSNHAVSGSAVVVDPNTGAVLAMANYPTYDPNNYGAVTDYSVFSNDVVSDNFEPGSGFKVFTMTAGLATGKVTPTTTYDDTGSFVVDGRTINNASNEQFGTQTMIDVIQKSLNTGAMFVLRMLGGDVNTINLAGKKVLYGYIKKFGFGLPTGIEQADEASGIVNAPSNVSGNDVNYANMTFGQGISITMIQMVMAISAIANGGTLYQPHVVDKEIDPNGKTTIVQSHVVTSHLVTSAVSKELTNMMIQVVQHGSGYLAKLPGYDVAGKTGTAQVPLANGQGYNPNANIGSFVGYAPAYAPKFVLMVRINEPQTSGFAESTTVPVFAAISKWLLQYEQVPPAQ